MDSHSARRGVMFGLVVGLCCAGCDPPPPGPTLQVLDIAPDGFSLDGSELPAGRIADITLDPSTPTAPRRYLAIAESGGIWESRDDGLTWRPRRGMDRYGARRLGSILFDPSDATGATVLLTSSTDAQTPSAWGVYRSGDGGATWAPVSTPRPVGCVGGAGEIAFDPTRPQRVWVAAGCAVGVSQDSGRSFQWVVPDASTQGFADVLVTDDGAVFACGLNGLYQLDPSDPTFARWTSIPYSQPQATDCRIAAAPGSSSTLFVASHWTWNTRPEWEGPGTEVFEADSTFAGGWAFTALLGDSKPNGRPVGVYTVPRGGGRYDVYYSDSVGDSLLPCSSTGTPTQCPLGPRATTPGTNWVYVPSAEHHADTTRLIFDPNGSRCILLRSSDGGIDRPGPGDCNGTGTAPWIYQNRGLHAHEVVNMSGTRLGGGDLDLYISIWDNGRLFRRVRGGDWVFARCSDGEATIVEHRKTDGRVPRLMFYDNDREGRTEQYFTSQRAFAMPPAPWSFLRSTWGGRMRMDAFGPSSFVLAARNGTSTQIFATTTHGDMWEPIGGAIVDPAGRLGGQEEVKAANDTSEVFYARSGGLLVRISGATSAGSSMRTADAGLTDVGRSAWRGTIRIASMRSSAAAPHPAREAAWSRAPTVARPGPQTRS